MHYRLYPFVEDAHFDEAASILEKGLSSVAPFEVSLEFFGHFRHKKESTMWLAPHQTPIDAMDRLHAALLSCFPQYEAR